jgi:hypothetical protein
MWLGASNRVLLPVRWAADIHHLNLTLRMIYGTLLITLGSINNLLTTIWSFLALLHVACIDDLFLVTLKNLCWVCRDCTTTPLLETKAARLRLWTQCDAVLSFVYLVVHLTCLIPTVNIETSGTWYFVICVVMLHIHCVSTHGRLRLTLHLSCELVELIVLLLLLMITTDVQTGWASLILATHLTVFMLFSFQIIVGQITDLVLKLLLMILAVVMNILAANYIVCILY